MSRKKAVKHYDPPVTVVVRRHVKRGQEKAFEKLVAELSIHANQFTGHLGTNLFRPTTHFAEYTIIYKFDSMSHFHAWKTSAIRKAYY